MSSKKFSNQFDYRGGFSAHPNFQVSQPRVLVLTSNLAIQRNVTRSLVSIGCDAHPCDMDGLLLAKELGQHYEMFVIDGDNPECITFIEQIRREDENAVVLVLTRDLDNPHLLEMLSNQGVNNLIARHGVSASQELIDESELITTCHKLFTSDIFGLEKYLTAYGVGIYENIVGSTAEKERALEEMSSYLERIQCHQTILHMILSATDELILNAMFNAPHDATGKPKYRDCDRAKGLKMENGERISVQYACDGRSVAVSVKDPFGKLDRESVLRYLGRHFLGSRAKVNFETAGAGVGLHMIFGSVTQLVFNVQPGQCTEIIALFYIRSGPRTFRNSGRSLNFFSIPALLKQLLL